MCVIMLVIHVRTLWDGNIYIQDNKTVWRQAKSVTKITASCITQRESGKIHSNKLELEGDEFPKQ